MKYGPFQLLIRRRSYVQKPTTRSPQSKLKLAAVFSVLMKNHSWSTSLEYEHNIFLPFHNDVDRKIPL